MANYDFKSLSSYDFECLCRDLIQEERKIHLESFKTGRDGGIDFRYSASPKQNIILQVKHYAESNYSILFNKLKNEELKKIKKINPSSYLLCTSLGLTPSNKDNIKELLEPYCKLTMDIYGKDDLNNILGKFPAIEKRNFKLWLTSQAVLERILHSTVYNQSELAKENIIKKLKYYVQNESFSEANKILDELHYCIIAGIPGIGKTTLAEILLIAYLDRGYEIIKVSNDISEAVEVYKNDTKQFFYYDDFLGLTRLGDKLNKNEDERILSFIATIRKSKYARFILTTREYILNQAKEIYEKLSNSNFDTRKCVIDLSSYSKFDRAKILFNHIYFSDLPSDFKASLLHNRNYQRIINHQNFNPRTIEWMTDYVKNIKILSKDYVAIFLRNLDNPERIWEHSFTRQISNASRCLLIVLYSLPEEVFLEDLEMAFLTFYENQAKHCKFSTYHHDFKSALKELEGNFIFIDNIQSHLIIKFHNPSIKDYLENYLLKESKLIEELIESAVYFEQCVKLLDFEYKPKRLTEVLDSFEKYLKSNKFNKNLDLLKKIPKLVWSSLENNFEQINCRLVTVQSGKDISKRRADISLEMRLLFAIELANTLIYEDSSKIIGLMLQTLLNYYKRNKTNKWALLELLLCLSEVNFKYFPLKDDFLRQMKTYFLDTLNEIEDFEYLIEFIGVFPDLFLPQELKAIELKFVSFYKDDYNYILSKDDFQYISQYSDHLENISDFLKIDATEEISELRQKAEEVTPFEPDFDDYDMYRWDRGDRELEDEAIDSLFDSLKD